MEYMRVRKRVLSAQASAVNIMGSNTLLGCWCVIHIVIRLQEIESVEACSIPTYTRTIHGDLDNLAIQLFNTPSQS
jgi:hypothetical protein